VEPLDTRRRGNPSLTLALTLTSTLLRALCTPYVRRRKPAAAAWRECGASEWHDAPARSEEAMQRGHTRLLPPGSVCVREFRRFPKLALEEIYPCHSASSPFSATPLLLRPCRVGDVGSAAQEDLIPTCRELGIGIVAYSPLGRGFLTGQYKSQDDFEEGDSRKSHPRMLGDNFQKARASARGCWAQRPFKC